MRHKNLRSTSQVQRDYDKHVDDYDKVRYGTVGGRYVDRKETEFVGTIIRGSSVLEVGTATGRFAVSLTRRGAEYTGVDLSQRMLRETFERTNHSASVLQMDGSRLGFRSHFDYALCVRTFHFLPKPVEALQGMFDALRSGGECLVTFETDNFLRRVLLFFGVGTSEQYYYKISDVEEMFLNAGFKISRSGSVMRIPVTLYRRCPRMLLPILKRLERLWPWSMHDYVLASK
ncbi:MAG TPA: methyltransferase domain-containing protein [Candidatus Dormibacteraeota bacterium]|jgi:SAM-dependent methyltransferase|nr:methyltransferase domain-containing protein [Candidatus Dormibacteraeota bacterium]